MTFGGGCNVGYHQGSATAGVLNADALARGFAVVSNSLLVNETNCNPVLAAEAAAMTKERLIEVYGPVRHTIGLGGSGGAIMQYTITHGYPGILDGLLPIISYADAVSNAGPPDCALLMRYLATPTGATLTAAQRQAIGGHQLFGVCPAWVGHVRRPHRRHTRLPGDRAAGDDLPPGDEPDRCAVRARRPPRHAGRQGPRHRVRAGDVRQHRGAVRPRRAGGRRHRRRRVPRPQRRHRRLRRRRRHAGRAERR